MKKFIYPSILLSTALISSCSNNSSSQQLTETLVTPSLVMFGLDNIPSSIIVANGINEEPTIVTTSGYISNDNCSLATISSKSGDAFEIPTDQGTFNAYVSGLNGAEGSVIGIYCFKSSPDTIYNTNYSFSVKYGNTTYVASGNIDV